MELDTLSRAELLDLRNKVDAALETLETRRKGQARSAAEAIAKEHGFSLAELVAAEKVAKKKGQKNEPKYCNPANPTQTWTGRGRQPGWIRDAINAGTSLKTLEI